RVRAWDRQARRTLGEDPRQRSRNSTAAAECAPRYVAGRECLAESRVGDARLAPLSHRIPVWLHGADDEPLPPGIDRGARRRETESAAPGVARKTERCHRPVDAAAVRLPAFRRRLGLVEG